MTTGMCDIAIVGLAVDLPGASNTRAFWSNLRAGIESIEPRSDEQLIAAGESRARIQDPNYVRATAPMQDFDQFDADFFGFSPKEAAILDPQHRKFLEVAWSAMEDAGHPPESLNAPIGVYAGCGMGSYFYFNICSNPDLVDDVGMFLLRHTGNDKDFLSTRVSHVFDLKGPSVNVQTACSTSLVAVHYACEALRSGECGMAIAGGVTIELPQGRGYLYKENEILSPDGHCHAFDHRAQGTVFGSGAGAVALRRLDDAMADGDHIWAVIKGSAINNDGADKAGYLAPSVGGQSAAVNKALNAADVPADSIDYVECHGTGTYLGDPIEVTALTEAFRKTTDQTGYCRIGSVKTNIGHLDTAAGVAGLAKTALSLSHKELPPSLGYEAPNPAIDFDHSPFQVNAALTPWETRNGPRRAGVNALGVGGTNAHVVLEEAPERPASEDSDFPFHVLCLSGQSKAALDANSATLADWLEANPTANLADVAFTLKEGRRGFAKRRVLVAETPAEAAELLREGDPRKVFTHDHLGDDPEVVFMFPGGGAQYAGMARDLYETEPVFADWMDRGLDHLNAQLDYDIRTLWLPDDGDMDAANAKLQQPSVQLPLIMIVEYALAQLWMSWGVKPTAMVGHSMGENTAACLAGVMSFEDCIDLVLLRGRLFDRVPKGGMLSIALPLDQVQNLIGPDLDIASVNAPSLTAVSGPQAALDALSARLAAQDIDHQRIQIDIAAHSRMLDGILNEYRDFLRGLTLSEPQMEVLSNRTGLPLTATQATDPDYWVGQLRNTVMFADCIATLAARPNRIFLEVGPGKALSALAQMAPALRPAQVLSSLRHPEQDVMDDTYFFGVIGRLWACGLSADWDQIWGEAKRHRLSLPTYAFQRSRYFIEPGKGATQPEADLAQREDDMRNWGWRPMWRPRLADCPVDVDTELDQEPQTWLLFEDDLGQAAGVAVRLENAGHRVVRVRPGDTFAQLSDRSYLLAPEEGRMGYGALLACLEEADLMPDRIGHFWLLSDQEVFRPGSSFFDRNLEMGIYSLTALAQELGTANLERPLHITVFTSGAAQLRDEALPYPEKALIAGPAGVIPREIPGVTCATVDLDLPKSSAGLLARIKGVDAPDLSQRLIEDLLAEPANSQAIWRGQKRFERQWRPAPLPPAQPAFKQGGTYLITGGFGGIGLTIARHLMSRYGANVALLGREGVPARDLWAQHLATHSPANRTSQRITALKQLEEIGKGRVIALAANVANSSEMQRAISTATDAFGELTGVIHGAGQIADAPLLAKSEDQMAKVLAPKVSGLRVLDDLFPDGSLELLLLFSSSSTATRPAGQVDYIAANEYLNAFAASRQGGDTQVLALDWGVWADAGMAADAMVARRGDKRPTDWVDCTQPLLDQQAFDALGNPVFRLTLDARRDWLVDEHRSKDGIALMPGTGYIELATQALAALGHQAGAGSTALNLADLYFLRPLIVADDRPAEMLIRLLASEDGYEVAFYSLTDGGYSLHAELQASPSAETTLPEPLPLEAIRGRCGDLRMTATQRLTTPQEANLAFGPRWHVLEEMRLGTGEGIARLALPDAAQRDGGILHPSLLDLATGWAIELAPSFDASTLWVPLSYQSLRIHAPLTAEIHSHMRLSAGASTDASTVVFDITLSDPTGQVLAEIEGFRMQRFEGVLQADAVPQADLRPGDIAMAATSSSQPLSPDEQRLYQNIRDGIRAEDAPEALERAITLARANTLPQVLVSALNLKDLIAQADTAPAAEDDSSQTFERPQLDTDYVAPSNAVEDTLAGYFQTLLGVAQVGTADSFFDLGGHSLIAVRLFAQIKRAYGLEFPLSLLFEAPTVAALSQRIIDLTGGNVSSADSPAAQENTQQAAPQFTHLVKLHPGDGTRRRPFFIVAGMFGNVLNLRHLAQLLGDERPVYGLQARGLVGDEAPHTTLVQAATDYLAEIRQVQAEGPYLLGGFSGGGLTAYEMAQQLEQQGEETAALVMLDTPLPLRPALNRADKALIKTHEMRRKGPGYLLEWAKNRILWEIEKRRASPPETTGQTGFNNRKIELAFRAALETYDLRQWHGPLSLFRPPLDRHWKVTGGNWVSAAREYVYEDNQWGPWADALEVIEVPGDHDSMVLEPNVSVLASALRQRLNAADKAIHPPNAPFQEAAE